MCVFLNNLSKYWMQIIWVVDGGSFSTWLHSHLSSLGNQEVYDDRQKYFANNFWVDDRRTCTCTQVYTHTYEHTHLQEWINTTSVTVSDGSNQQLNTFQLSVVFPDMSPLVGVEMSARCTRHVICHVVPHSRCLCHYTAHYERHLHLDRRAWCARAGVD